MDEEDEGDNSMGSGGVSIGCGCVIVNFVGRFRLREDLNKLDSIST